MTHLFRLLSPVLFPGLFLVAGTGCSGHKAAGAAPTTTASTAPRTVKVATAVMVPWPRSVRVQGNLRSDEEALIGAKVAGRVREIRVDRGTQVREGEVLIELEPEEFSLRVQSAEAQLNQVRAKLGLRPGDPEEKLDRSKAPPVVQEQAMLAEERLKLDRSRSLIRQSAAAIEEVQREEAALRVAEARLASALNLVEEQISLLGVRRAELALARQQQSDAVIRAPFQGTVQRRQVARGVYLQVGDPVLTLVRTDPLRFVGGVPEREAAQVRVGQEVFLDIEGDTRHLPARISRVSPALEMTNRSLLIEIDLNNPDGRLRAGLFAEADLIIAPDAKTLAVPDAAVFEFAGVEKVWVVRNGAAEERRVHTGRRDHGQVEIIDGLSTSEVYLVDAREGRAGPVTTVTP